MFKCKLRRRQMSARREQMEEMTVQKALQATSHQCSSDHSDGVTGELVAGHREFAGVVVACILRVNTSTPYM